MKERVADLVGPRAKAMWVMTFHSACVRILRREATRARPQVDLLDLRRRRQPAADDPGPARPRPRPEALPRRGRFSHAGEQPQERPRRRGDVRLAGRPRRSHHERTVAEAYTHVPAPAAPGQRARLRRPHHDDRPPAAGLPRRRPSTTGAGSGTSSSTSTRTPTTRSTSSSGSSSARSTGDARAPRRAAGRAVRRRRRRPVDLCVPRRDDPQHPRVRAGLPRRAHDPARAELPLDADASCGRPTPSSPATRSRRAKNLWTDSGDGVMIVGYVGRQRARRGGVRREARSTDLADSDGVRPRRRRGLLPHQRPVPRVRGGVRPGRPALQGRRRHAVLRATRGQGRARLPPRHLQPRRHGQPAAHHQRPQARHRRPGGGLRGGAGRARAHPVRRRARPRRGRPGHRHPLGRRDQGLHHAAGATCARSGGRRTGVAGAARGGPRARAATSPSCAPAPTPRTRPAIENLAELVAVAREFERRADRDRRGHLARGLPRAGLARRRRRRDPRRPEARPGPTAASSR